VGVPNSELIGKTPEQKKVTKYFLDTGLLAALLRMKDEEYEQMVMSKLNSLNLKKKALGKIGLDEDQVKEIAPVFLHGYNFDDESYVRIGSDDRLRSSRYDGTWLFFSDTHVYMYSYTLDMASDYKRETTEEYFYKDVTNLSTSSESKPFAKLTCSGQEVKKTREFSRFSLVVPGDKFFCSMAGVTAAEAEKSVNAMKQKLREKKQQ
jgi:hypothetical protein